MKCDAREGTDGWKGIIREGEREASVRLRCRAPGARRHSHMTSTRPHRGGKGLGPKEDKNTDRLRDCDSYKGEGIENPEIFCDVICE